MNIKHKFRLVLFLIALVVSSTTVEAQKNEKFTVVLDAGHGGKDTGAHYHGKMEKDANLDVTLKVGKILEQNPNINVIYTRKTDVFIELRERAKIANRANANLFVSIHCNANKNTAAYGSETYVMGMARANMNLEVSKTENSVIFLEDNYKQTYKGFDPNNPETLIGLKMVQENNLTSSIDLATKIQNNFISNNIKSRGVRQEPLWVLDATVMPGVLIEIGFISNIEEGNRISSEEGQKVCATSIAKAIVAYKKEFFGSSSNEPTIESAGKYIPKISEEPKDSIIKDEKPKDTIIKNEKPIAEIKPELSSDGIIFKVQIMAANQKVDLKPKNFKGLKNVSVAYETGGLYKYTYGSTSDYETARRNLQEAKDKGFSSAYLIAFKDGKRIDIKDAIK